MTLKLITFIFFFIFNINFVLAEDLINIKFLTFDDFNNLTVYEKKQYVKHIRNLIKDITDDTKVSLFEYLFLNSAIAQTSRSEYNTVSENAGSELNNLDSLYIATKLFKKATLQHGSLPTTQQLYEDNLKTFVERMNNVSRKPLTEKEQQMYKRIKARFIAEFPDQQNNFSDSLTDSKRALRPAITSKPTKAPVTTTTLTRGVTPLAAPPTPQPLTVTTTNTRLPTTTPSVSPPTAQPQSRSKAHESKTETPYCIYSGFVIYENSCQPNKKLPSNFILDEIDSNLFVCAKESEILCNPLIFGYKTFCNVIENKHNCIKKPICINRSTLATQNCLNLTNTTESIDQVLKLWSNPKNKLTYEKFMNDLNQLCNHSNIKTDDVIKTCKVTANRFNKIIESTFSGQTNYLNKKINDNKTSNSSK